MFEATHHIQSYKLCKACGDMCDPDGGRFVRLYGWLCDKCIPFTEASAETEWEDRRRGFND